MMTKHWLKIISLPALLVMALYAPNALADDDYDDDDDYRPRSSQKATYKTSKQASQKYISRQKAGQIARAQVKGSRVKSIDFDSNDDGYGATYDVEVVAGRAEYDVKINAKTGKVIYKRRDR